MILVAGRLVRHADPAERDERNEDLAVVHETSQDGDLARRRLDRAHVDLRGAERPRGEHHHIAADVTAWTTADRLCGHPYHPTRGINLQVSHIVSGQISELGIPTALLECQGRRVEGAGGTAPQAATRVRARFPRVRVGTEHGHPRTTHETPQPPREVFLVALVGGQKKLGVAVEPKRLEQGFLEREEAAEIVLGTGDADAPRDLLVVRSELVVLERKALELFGGEL